MPLDADEAKYELLLQQITRQAERCGLYVENLAIAPAHPVEEGERPRVLAVYGAFNIGDLAWRARVQDPEQATFDKGFREMRDEMEHSEFDGMAERLLEQRRRLEQRGEEDPG